MKKVNIVCEAPRYAEFPELKYGTNGEQNYCDVTQFLVDSGLSETHNINKFQRDYGALIIKSNKEYQIPPEDSVVVNVENNHILLAGELGLMFLMYTNPSFLCYSFERLDDMLTYGVAISDNKLHHEYNSRFPNELPPSIH